MEKSPYTTDVALELKRIDEESGKRDDNKPDDKSGIRSESGTEEEANE